MTAFPYWLKYLHSRMFCIENISLKHTFFSPHFPHKIIVGTALGTKSPKQTELQTLLKVEIKVAVMTSGRWEMCSCQASASLSSAAVYSPIFSRPSPCSWKGLSSSWEKLRTSWRLSPNSVSLTPRTGLLSSSLPGMSWHPPPLLQRLQQELEGVIDGRPHKLVLLLIDPGGPECSNFLHRCF